MVRSARRVRLTLQLAALTAVSVLGGTYMGWSAIGMIDPLYYQPVAERGYHGLVSYHADPAPTPTEPVYQPQPYAIAYPYPYAYVPRMRQGGEPESLLSDAGRDVAENSDLHIVSAPDATGAEAGCDDCGGPYIPAEDVNQPAPPADCAADAPCPTDLAPAA